MLLTTLILAASPALQGPREGEARAYFARLAERGLYAEIVREGEQRLRTEHEPAERDWIAYQVAEAHLALGRDAAAAPVFERLAATAGFDSAAQAAVRAAECALRAGDDAAAERWAGRSTSDPRPIVREAALLVRGRARLARTQLDAAAEDFRAVRASATDAARRRAAEAGLAWCDVRAGRPAAAESAARALLSAPEIAADERGELLALRGEALLDLSRAADARAAFESIPPGPWRESALRGLAFAFAAEGDHAAAARAFQAALREHPEGRHAAECALHAGIELLAAHDAAGALAALADPRLESSLDAAEWRARAALAAGDPRAALSHAADAAQRAGGDTQRLGRLDRLRAEALEAAGRTDEAARAFAELGDARARLDAARLCLARGDARAAHAHARAALEDPSFARGAPADVLAQAWIAVGEAAFQLEAWTEAAEAFERGAAGDPDPARAARARLRAAWARQRGGDAASAARLAHAAATALPAEEEREEARFLAARCLEDVDAGRARDAWSEYLSRHGGAPRATQAALRLARLSPPAEARAVLSAAWERGHDAAAAYELAELCSGERDWIAARAAYEAALESGAGALEPAALYGLAWSCAAAGDDAAAVRALDALDGMDARASRVERALACAAAELRCTLRARGGDVRGALTAWAQLARACDDAARAREALSVLLVPAARAGLSAEAHAALDTLIARSPGAERGLVEIERAWLALAGGDPEAAVAALGRAQAAGTAAEPISEVRVACGAALLSRGDPAGAAAQFEAAASVRSPQLDRALHRLAHARLESGDPDAARAATERFVRDCPDSPLRPAVLALRGEACARLERWADCVASLTAARGLVREPDAHANLLYRLGTALVRTGDARSAAEALGELERGFPAFAARAAAELERGRALSMLGDERGALVALGRAVEAGGAIASRGRLERARLAWKRGDGEAALSDALKAALLCDDPASSPDALWLAGEILERQGSLEAARDRWGELARRYPRHALAARAEERLAQDDERSRGGARPRMERTREGEPR